jgi:hypothetical protein
MIATTMNAAISERTRSSVFDPGLAAVPDGGIRLSRLWFVREPADSSGFHWIQRDDDFFDVTAFGAVERAKLESRRPRRDARKHHSRSAFRAAESLNSQQWDCGWVIGHGIPPLDRAGPPNSQSPGGDDGNNMISGVQSRWSILLTFRKLIVWQTGRPRLFQLKAAWSLMRPHGLRIVACARRGEPAIDGICLKCRAEACCPLLDRLLASTAAFPAGSWKRR